MYPADIIKILYDLLPDCRAPALTCSWWYSVYKTTTDYEFWFHGRHSSYVLPKMIPTVWDDCIGDLVCDQNIPAIMRAIDILPQSIKSSVVKDLVDTAVECLCDDVVKYFIKNGLSADVIKAALRFGEVKYLLIDPDMSRKCIRSILDDVNLTSTFIDSTCVDILYTNGFKDEAIKFWTSYNIGTYLAVKTGHLSLDQIKRTRYIASYYREFPEQLPTPAHVLPCWSFEDVKWYMNNTDHKLNIDHFNAAIETGSLSKISLVWDRIKRDSPEIFTNITTEAVPTINMWLGRYDDILEITRKFGTHPVNVFGMAPHNKIYSYDEIAEIMRINKRNATIVTMVNIITDPKIIKLFDDNGIKVIYPHRLMYSVRNRAEFEKVLDHNPVSRLTKILPCRVWKAVYKNSRAATVDYLVGKGYDRGEVTTLSYGETSTGYFCI